MSEIILDQALIGPAPNALVLGYLKHCLASQVVSHASVLQSISKFEQWHKPHCTATLLELAKSAKGTTCSKAKIFFF